jgi:hypothetical protein
MVDVNIYGSSIYINVSSEDSSIYFPDNKAGHFRVKLEKRLELAGCWKIALCEISVSNVKVKSGGSDSDREGEGEGEEAAGEETGVNVTQDTIYVHCSVCVGLIVNGVQTRVLRTLPIKKNQYKIYPIQYYMPLETRYIDTIEFHICTSDGKALSFDVRKGKVSMTLRLKQC